MSQQIHSLCLSKKQKWNIKDPCKSRRMVSGDKDRKVVLQASLTLHFDRTDLNAPLPVSGENRMILDTIQVLAYN